MDIFTNFEEYGLPKPEILRMDSTVGLLKSENLFDAIICDPPYGWRASARESGPSDRSKRRKEKLGDDFVDTKEPGDISH